MSEKQAELGVRHLERQQVKENLIQKGVIDVEKAAQRDLYLETLQALTPVQLQILVEKNYMRDGRFLPYEKIVKDFTYRFLIQKSLNNFGADLRIDGYDGPQTQGAIEAFQAKHDLQVDGKVGPLTLQVIDEALKALVIPVKQETPIRSKESLAGLSKKELALLSSSVTENTPKTPEGIAPSSRQTLFQSIPAYESVRGSFQKFFEQYTLTPEQTRRFIHLIAAENKQFSTHRTNFTPIGQVGRDAWIDAYHHLGLTPPRRSKKNRYAQLVATYGYMKLCGIMDAKNQSDLNVAYTKYNLGPRHRNDRAQTKRNFKNQAKTMQAYAHAEAKKHNRAEIIYSDILVAEGKYYTNV